MPLRPVRLSVYLAVALMSASRLAAQAGTLQGTVSDSGGTTLPNASVSVEGTGLRATTGANGGYEVRGVPAGTYTVRARLIGFQAGTERVTVAGGDVVRQDFTLGRSTVQLAPIDVVVGSRARHTAAEELAVPVDVYPAERLAQQGSTETSVILQAVSPSINFPRQSVTDAGDIVRPFTLRGLSPDHTLVLLNGWRQHQTALVNNFTYGMGAGSSGVDLNAIPSSALDRVEVLRDGAAAQYGSDAIAGVVNLVLKDGAFTPFLNGDVGRYTTDDYPDDGTTVNVNGGWGIPVGRGSPGRVRRVPGPPADQSRLGRSIRVRGHGRRRLDQRPGQVVHKNNPVPQPNHHWGDGLEKDALGFANFRMPINAAGSSELYAFGGYSHRDGEGNPFRRYAGGAKNWDQIYPLGFLPIIGGKVTDFSMAGGLRGVVSGWNYDARRHVRPQHVNHEISNTLNASLGPCLDVPCAPGVDGVLGTATTRASPISSASSPAACCARSGSPRLNVAKPVELGLRNEVNLAFGVAFRRERYAIRAGELGSLRQRRRDGSDRRRPRPQRIAIVPGLHARSTRPTAIATTSGCTRMPSPTLLDRSWPTWPRGTRTTATSARGSAARPRSAISRRRRVTLRAAASTGFRAPGLSQVAFSKVVTNVIAGPVHRHRPVARRTTPRPSPSAPSRWRRRPPST